MFINLLANAAQAIPEGDTEAHEIRIVTSTDALGRMVFLTGGAFTPAVRAFLGRVPNERIEKPFDPTAVRALVKSRSVAGEPR